MSSQTMCCVHLFARLLDLFPFVSWFCNTVATVVVYIVNNVSPWLLFGHPWVTNPYKTHPFSAVFVAIMDKWAASNCLISACKATWSIARAGPLHRMMPSINSSSVTCSKKKQQKYAGTNERRMQLATCLPVFHDFFTTNSNKAKQFVPDRPIFSNNLVPPHRHCPINETTPPLHALVNKEHAMLLPSS